MSVEEATFRAFATKARRDRLLALLGNRKKLRAKLPHQRWLDDRFAQQIPPHQQTPDAIAERLHALGAPRTCWAISEDPDIDGREWDLREVLHRIVGVGNATLLSCKPGTLGYFEDEEPGERYVLQRD